MIISPPLKTLQPISSYISTAHSNKNIQNEGADISTAKWRPSNVRWNVWPKFNKYKHTNIHCHQLCALFIFEACTVIGTQRLKNHGYLWLTKKRKRVLWEKMQWGDSNGECTLDHEWHCFFGCRVCCKRYSTCHGILYLPPHPQFHQSLQWILEWFPLPQLLHHCTWYRWTHKLERSALWVFWAAYHTMFSIVYWTREVLYQLPCLVRIPGQ